MTLNDLVAGVFAPGGALARVQSRYRPRPQQQAMAQAVADAIRTRTPLVVEAGTGVGKTFAYLVPALLSGERVLISTATRALQDQLHGRDLPLLLRALALPLRTAMLKGRGSYLCLHRLDLARLGPQASPSDALAAELGGCRAWSAESENRPQRDQFLPDLQPNSRAIGQKAGEKWAAAVDLQPAISKSDSLLEHVERWAQATQTGDLAELSGLDERSPTIARVTSTSDNCLGHACPRFAQCHVYQARRAAMSADVVVINHHLFFADLALRRSGMGPWLPDAGVVVFDEAHRLMDTAAQFLGVHWSGNELLELGQDLLAAGLRHARGLADWQALREALRGAARALRRAAGPADTQAQDDETVQLAWAGEAPDGVDVARWQAAQQTVVDALRRALAALDGLTCQAPELAHLHARTVALLQRLQHFSEAGSADCVRWLERGGMPRMHESPLDLAPALRPLWGRPDSDAGAWDEEDESPERSPALSGRGWVFTSATLGADSALGWFTDACALEDARTLCLDSPFDHARQAALHVPQHLPAVGDAGHSEQLAHWVADAAERLGGRTLVLTTSLRALQIIGQVLQRRLAATGGIEVLVQGQAPRRHIMERFRAPAAATGHVLVGSASFWEGFDVPGDALQLLVIDRLPFPSPGDPLVEARGRRLQQQGRSAFRDLALPAAAVALRQGVGRLIRSETDRGVLVVADQRLLRMGYGKRLLRALPPMRQLATQQEFEAALDALTRTSTRDFPGS